MCKSKLKLWIVSLLIGGFLLLTGCSSDNNPETSTDDEQDENVIIVGTDTSYVPFEFLDQETEEYVGFDIDLLKAIAGEVGFEYGLNPMDFSGIIPV